jgi:hypothetical protein
VIEDVINHLRRHAKLENSIDVERFDAALSQIAGLNDPQAYELYAPTIARMVPARKRWGSFSARNISQSEAKIAYIRLNTQTPCPPRGAVPVNRGCCGRLFHSQHPHRLP